MTDKKSPAPATLRGTIEKVFFAGGKFSAGRLKTDAGEDIQFAGNLFAQENDSVVLNGRWIMHPKYGRQFEVQSMEYNLDLDATGLANYLANNPHVKGIGPAKAKLIVERFGNDFDRALAEDAEAIAKTAKVSVDKIVQLRDEWDRTRLVNKALTWLASFDLTHHQVTTLVEKFGNNVLGVLKADPYLIIREVSGFGFKKVDKVARKMGTPKDHCPRIRAGIIHCLDEALDQGDCWVEYEDLLDRANLLLVMDTLDSRERIETELDALIDSKQLSCSSHGGRFIVARPDILAMETDLAEFLRRGDLANPNFDKRDDVSELVDRAAPSLNDGQRGAVTLALSHSITLISGGAGSGKTYTVSAITSIYEEQGLSVILAAPTGKAAKRLEQVVGHAASTIHRLLGFNGKTYARGPDDPLDADVIIIDEVSMVDVPLAWRLFRTIDLSRTAVVLVGDHNQLPPVGPGNMLRDLIQTRAVPSVVLDKVVRQAGVLKENCIAILNGEVRKTAEEKKVKRQGWYLLDQFTDQHEAQQALLEMFKHRIEDGLGFNLMSDVQVLTPTHKGPLGTVELNIKLQKLLQRKLWGVHVPDTPSGRRPKFHPFDKVIQTRNNYDLGVMNGAVGMVIDVDRKGSLNIDFDGMPVTVEASNLQDVQLAYALTIHKTQGSEFPCAIVIVHKSHAFMHHRNLFYTGVTRARETAIIIGDHWGIKNCVKKRHLDERKTFLSIHLAEPVSQSNEARP
ncbi:MAG TPA: AAA family ATPase [bacterium]|nr:AAA family ATPase [bacterium]